METISLFRLISIRDDAWIALHAAPDGSVEKIYLQSFHQRLTDILMDLRVKVDVQEQENDGSH